MTYVPFDATDEDVAARQVLRSGVPPTMRNALRGWVVRTISGGSGWVEPAKFHDIQNNLDLDLNLNPAFTSLMRDSDTHTILERLEGDALLRVVDYLLFSTPSAVPSNVEKVLREGRSKWRVVPEGRRHRLRARLSEGVQEGAEAIMARKDTAGKLLRRAWNGLYDLTPNDSGAYSMAVKAVETAALPVLGLHKPTATVSDAIRAIEKREATWRLPFKREHTEAPSRDVLLGMLKSLYRGQRDRHGSAAYEDVTHEEAEAAVLMAVTLVGWFTQGLVAERDTGVFG
ncbi:hypothetical protein [Ornithinimicrobium pratense]|uniref:TIGR02391 family protein n=1 Tax=Ornithinimicrobium pratense TaxID=2593973 RepID=A0A5J6V521_9MICO|nr:hypothetical protein [Ornithinimicrobium pratense]QFG69049.1 hypothetical protein FY030_10345 [Ornithinimicrobium pratense]